MRVSISHEQFYQRVTITTDITLYCYPHFPGQYIANVTNQFKLTPRDLRGLFVVEKRPEDSEVYGGVCDDGFTDTTAATLCSYFGWARGRKGPSQLLRNGTSYVSTRLTCEGERLGSCKDRPYPDRANSTEYMCDPQEQASVYCFNGEIFSKLFVLIHVSSSSSLFQL